MSSLFALRALLFGGELLAGSALIVALVMIGTSMKAASARHLAWTCAFGVLLALPLMATILPSAFHIWLPAPPAPVEMASDTAFVPVVQQPAPSAFSFDTATIALMLGALWLAGVMLVALRFAIGGACLALLKHRSRPYTLAPGDEPKVNATAQECELRLCHSETGPIVWGIFRPVILLPKSAHLWTRERMQTVLLHELAHIRRRDSLTRALSQAACALYWPNPLVWMAAKELRHEAEIAADDAVIAWGIKPSAYAGELLKLAQEFRAREPAFSSMALFMAEPSALEARVQSVLAPTQARKGVTSMDVLKISGLGFVAAAALALACPSLAQEETSPAPDASAVTASDLPPPASAAAAQPSTEQQSAQQPQTTPATQARRHASHAASASARTMVADDARADDTAPAAPPAPPIPAAPVAPALPAADQIPAAPPAPPAPASPAAAATPSTTHVWVDGHQIWADGPNVRIDGSHTSVDGHNVWIDGHRLDDPNFQPTPAEKQRMREDIEKARRQAQEAMDKVRPEIERARAEVEAHRADIEKALATQRADIERSRAQVRDTVRVAQAQAEQAARDGERRRVEVERVGNDLRVREETFRDTAVAEAKSHHAAIEAAMAKVKPELDKALAKIKAEMAKQHVDVRIQEHLDEALRHAELRIEASDRHEHEHTGERRIEVREDHRSEDPNTVVTPNADTDDEK
jgi:beta-lactamase regulating signal transducer with metallopeptidase domain